MSLQESYAQAHVNWGRWIASCPNLACNSAEELHPWAAYKCGHRDCARVTDYPEALFHCSECHVLVPIAWPPDAEEIWDALLERPSPQTRNWYPEQHELAGRMGLARGQSADDLRAEAAAERG